MARAGAYSGAYVVDLGTGSRSTPARPTSARMPASVEKLYTTAGALLRYGADGRLDDDRAVRAPAGRDRRRSTATSYLRGGGDPTFNAAAAGRAGRSSSRTPG